MADAGKDLVPAGKLSERDAQRLVHTFVGTWEQAVAKAIEINERLEFTPNGPMVPVSFGPLGSGVMLRSAAIAAGLVSERFAPRGDRG